jgi:hypothetical protein
MASTVISLIALIVAITAAFISWLSWSVNRDKLRLDLYNKRFDIYSKTIDLYLKLPSYESYDSLDDDKKKDFQNYERQIQDFIKYHRESLFLFSKESCVHEKIKVILEKINDIMFYIRRPPKQAESDLAIEKEKKVSNHLNSLAEDLRQLELSIGTYLIFPGYKPLDIPIFNRFSHFCRKT